MQTVKFDIGVFTFKRQIAGFICPDDDQKTQNGAVFAVLQPFQNVDPKGLYCFGVDKASGATKTLARKNLKFNKVVTLKFTRDGLMTSVEEVHAKLNAAVAYFRRGEQMEIKLDQVPQAGQFR